MQLELSCTGESLSCNSATSVEASVVKFLLWVVVVGNNVPFEKEIPQNQDRKDRELNRSGNSIFYCNTQRLLQYRNYDSPPPLSCLTLCNSW